MSMSDAQFRSWEIVDPRNLQVVEQGDGGNAMGLLLKSLSSLFRVYSAPGSSTLPEGQLLNLSFVCRLITILEEAHDFCVVYKLHEFNRWVSRGSVICVEGEEQMGEDTSLRHLPVLIVWVLDVIFPSLTCCLLCVRKFAVR